GKGTAYSFLGLAYLADGQYQEAKFYLLESLEVFREYTTGWNIGRSLTYLGDAARLAGNETEAKDYYKEGLRASIEGLSIPIALDALLGLGYLQDQSGETENAILLSFFVLNHPSSEVDAKVQAGQLFGNLEPKLTSEQIETLCKTASEKTFDEIVEFALRAA
ncbi:MAG: tetratricopeptide repeat protein, partial [Chloroflexi bacterium]